MKTKLTACLILFAVSLNAQILNAGFEEWDLDPILNVMPVPQNWYYGGGFPSFFLRDTLAAEGDFAISLVGSYGPADGPIVGLVQQKIVVPHGLVKIDFLGMAKFRSIDPLFDFFGFGLTKDTIDPKRFNTNMFLVRESSKDTTSQYKRFSFSVPDSLWGQSVYLTFYSRPTGWGSISGFRVDGIQLVGDFTTSTDNIEKNVVTNYPNPTSDWLLFKNIPPKTKYLEVLFYDGKFVWKGQYLEKLNVSDYKSGIYFLIGKDEYGEVLFTNSFIKN